MTLFGSKYIRVNYSTENMSIFNEYGAALYLKFSSKKQILPDDDNKSNNYTIAIRAFLSNYAVLASPAEEKTKDSCDLTI